MRKPTVAAATLAATATQFAATSFPLPSWITSPLQLLLLLLLPAVSFSAWGTVFAAFSSVEGATAAAWATSALSPPILQTCSRASLLSRRQELQQQKRCYSRLLKLSMSPSISAAELILSWREHLQSDTKQHGSAVDGEKQSLDSTTASPTKAIRLILASQSPRRREILDFMGLAGRFDCIPSPLDEAALAAELRDNRNGSNGDSANSAIDPMVYTRILAERKALALAEAMTADHTDGSNNMATLILGSDTVVSFQSRILEKPIDVADAIRMLTLLQGQEHVVHTGVALVQLDRQAATTSSSTTSSTTTSSFRLIDSWTDSATVRFASLTEADIVAYVATGEPMDKAGSYGIQGVGGQLVSSIAGDFFTVMGLPMHRTSRLLAKAVSDIVEQVAVDGKVSQL